WTTQTCVVAHGLLRSALVRLVCVVAVPTTVYLLPLHDALPICVAARQCLVGQPVRIERPCEAPIAALRLCIGARQVTEAWCDDIDRKSTRLNSSHVKISYAVFCLKKERTVHARAVDTIAAVKLY